MSSGRNVPSFGSRTSNISELRVTVMEIANSPSGSLGVMVSRDLLVPGSPPKLFLALGPTQSWKLFVSPINEPEQYVEDSIYNY